MVGRTTAEVHSMRPGWGLGKLGFTLEGMDSVRRSWDPKVLTIIYSIYGHKQYIAVVCVPRPSHKNSLGRSVFSQICL